MNAFILIMMLMTSDGPVERRVDFGGAGRQCESVARAVRLGQIEPPPGVTVISARCVREYDA